MTVLLARNRPPPPTVAAGVSHAELAAELITLPSGLLAMVCEAIVKLKVRLGVFVCGVRAGELSGCMGDYGRVCACACLRASALRGEGRRDPGAPARVGKGQRAPLGVVRPRAE